MREVGVWRTLRALFARDVGNALRNPTVIVCCLITLALCWYMHVKVSMGSAGWGLETQPDAEAAKAWMTYVVSASAVFPATMAGCVTTLFVMAEEREHGSYEVMRRAGVSLGEILASKIAIGVLASVVFSLVALLPCVSRVLDLVLAAILVAAGSVPYVVLCVACGLLLRKQIHTNGLSVLLALASLVPIVASVSPVVACVATLCPTYFLAFANVAVLVGGQGAGGWAVALASWVAWLAVSSALLLWRAKRVAC